MNFSCLKLGHFSCRKTKVAGEWTGGMHVCMTMILHVLFAIDFSLVVPLTLRAMSMQTYHWLGEMVLIRASSVRGPKWVRNLTESRRPHHADRR